MKNKTVTLKEAKVAYASAMSIGNAEHTLITRHDPVSKATNYQRLLYIIIKAYQDVGDGHYDMAKQRLENAASFVGKCKNREWMNGRGNK
tara:strand:- start:722 stop:991 length:270 start_codon:yes stop_codon:yes gene_type:complete